MSRIGGTRVRVPETAKPGDVVEIRAMVEHPQNSGFMLDNTGKPIPRHIVESFDCTYNGKEVFRARLFPSVSTNPYFSFYLKATETGDLVFTWKDDQGGVATATQKLTVV